MRKSKAEAAETRKRIIDVAARAFKKNGIDGTNVSEIMTLAGLTHGGFYRHFASKDQLLAEACAASMNSLVETTIAAADGSDQAFLNHLEVFLSTEYRDECLGGCPLIAMGSELVRADGETRHIATAGFKGLVDAMTKRVNTDNEADARDAALFALSSMIGAVTMARVIDDETLSQRILEVTKKRLTRNSPEFVSEPMLERHL